MNLFSKLNYEFKHEEIQNDTLFVVDTNYFLYAFQSYSHGNKYLEALRSKKDNIYIPYIVFIEFYLKLDDVIASSIGEIKKLEESLKGDNISNLEKLISQDEIKNSIKKNTFTNTSFYDNSQKIIKDEGKKEVDGYINNVLDLITPKIEEINNVFLQEKNSFKNKTKDFLESDKYIESVELLKKEFEKEFFTEKNSLGSSYSQDKINEYLKDMDERYNNKVPPGFDDQGKDGYIYIGNIKIPKKAGDLLLWKEVIEHVTREENERYNNVIIVTNEKTKDWTEERNKNKLHKLLKLEFLQQTGKAVNIMSTDNFIKYFSDLDDQTGKEIEEEIKQFDTIKNSNIMNNIIFIYKNNKYKVNTQYEMMHLIFKEILENYSISPEKLIEIPCLSKTNIKNTRAFNKHFVIQTIDNNLLYLGTSINIQDKFRYIMRLFKLANINQSDLYFEDDHYQNIWLKTTNTLREIQANEIIIYLNGNWKTGENKIVQVYFLNNGHIVEDNLYLNLVKSLVNTEIYDYQISNLSYEEQIRELLKNEYAIDSESLEIDIIIA